MKHPRSAILLVELGVFLVVGVVLGFRMLTDPDIGWHVATGLWILDNRTVPLPDPFSSGGGTWIAYSWLPDVIYAVFFELRRFQGLQILQLLTILFSMWSLVYLVDSSATAIVLRASQGENTMPGSARCLRLARGLIYVILIPTATLIWHLRPQAISIALFALLIGLRERGERRLRYLVPLTILWVNIHIYWVFVPLVLACDFVADVWRKYKLERSGFPEISFAEGLTRLMLVFACVLANPYGLQHLQVLFQYAFQHDNAYRLITEFQPIYRQDWLIPAIYVVWIIAALLGAKQTARRSGNGSLFLGAIFAVAAFFQLKYLVAFAILVTPWAIAGMTGLLQQCGMRWGTRWGIKEKELPEASRPSVSVAIFFAGMLAIIGVGSFAMRSQTLSREQDNTLNERQKSVMTLVQQISAQSSGSPTLHLPCIILSDFNDSGWTILASYLVRRSTSKPLTSKIECRVAIDGRTLVTGGERMQEYALMQSSVENFEEIMHKWKISDFVLPSESQLAKWATTDLGASLRATDGVMSWLQLPPKPSGAS